MTEIGVQLGKGDEFANGVLKEMKAAVEKEAGIMGLGLDRISLPWSSLGCKALRYRSSLHQS